MAVEIGQDNLAQAQTSLHACLVAPGDPAPQNPFSGFFVFQVDNVGPQKKCQPVTAGAVGPAIHPLHAIRAWSASSSGIGVWGIGDVGKGGVGLDGQAGNPDGIDTLPPGVDNSGVFGSSVSTNPAAGLTSVGVTGQSDIGPGVVGVGGDAGVFGVGGPGSTGVVGAAGSGTADGVRGFGTGSFSGVAGFGDPAAGTGVYGQGACGVRGIGNGGPNTTPAGAVGVYGQAGPNSNGVEGHGAGTAAGVAGFGESGGFGVHGEGQALGVGVSGSAPSGGTGVQATGGIGLFASGGLAAGFFDGTVVVVGDLAVLGKKSAAVRHPDGSHRLLYSIESPESWFEDFGESRLVRGKVRVKLESGFASVIKANSYHVFLTPYGDSNGLYVSQRSTQGFEVREQGVGKASVRFSYRIVGKRKDIKGERLAKIALPKVKPQQFVSKPPIKLKAAPALPERLAKIALPKVKPKKVVSKGRRQN
jgi:hypothetical protein